MIIIYRWRGAGLVALIAFPVFMVVGLMASVNLLGKDFTKLHFQDLVSVAIFISGVFCLLIGRWLNREKVIQVDGESTKIVGTTLGDHHMLWGIPLHHWSWIYFAAAIVAFAISHT
jgi:hypothetical protein